MPKQSLRTFSQRTLRLNLARGQPCQQVSGKPLTDFNFPANVDEQFVNGESLSMDILKITLAASLALTTSFTHADGHGSANDEQVTILQEPEDDGNDYIIPLLFLGLVALAASSNNSSGGGTAGEGATVGSPVLPGDEGTVDSLSDVRLKTDITRIGTADNGLPVYTFRYKWSDTLYEGVMAQDVLRHTPSAVTTRVGGYYSVNYSALGLEMTVVE